MAGSFTYLENEPAKEGSFSYLESPESGSFTYLNDQPSPTDRPREVLVSPEKYLVNNREVDFADFEKANPRRRKKVDPVYRPAYDDATELYLSKVQKGEETPSWESMDPQQLVGNIGLIASAFPDQSNDLLKGARDRAKQLLKERNALLFEPSGDRYTVSSGKGRGRKDKVSDPDGLNRTVANVMLFSGGALAGPITDAQEWLGSKTADVLNVDPDEFKDAWNRSNSLSEENRQLMRVAYGDTANLFQAAGTLLAWAGGANAVLGKAGVSAISAKGLAIGAAYDAASGAVYGPEYAPTWIADMLGIEQSRLASAVEAAGSGLVVGTALRKLAQSKVLNQMRKRPEFADFSGTNKEFREFLKKKMAEWDAAQKVRSEQGFENARNVTPDSPKPPETIEAGPSKNAANSSAEERFMAARKKADAGRSEQLAKAEAESKAYFRPVDDSIDYSDLDSGGGQPAAGVLDDEDWLPDQKPVIADEAAVEGKEVTSILDPSQYPVYEQSLKSLTLSKDVPNFKENSDSETGVVEGQQLDGEFQRLGTAPIVVWERLNGSREIITGRHRTDLARRSGEKTIPAQLVREADGFTKQMALTFDAETNIRDGNGSVRDYAHYFRNAENLSEETARSRGLLSRVKGTSGWALGRHAENSLYDLYKNGQIPEAKAVAIARGAPGIEGVQQAAIKQAKSKNADELRLYAQNLARDPAIATGGQANQIGLFGDDDPALIEAEKISAVQYQWIRDNKDRIAAVQGAVRRPQKAREMGLDVSNPEAIQAEINRLKDLTEDLYNPSYELHQELRRRAGLKVTEAKQELDSGPIDDPNQSALFEPEVGYDLESANRRLTALRAAEKKGQLSQIQYAEIEALEKLIGQDFFQWHDDVKTQERLLADEDSKKRRMAELKSRAQSRLLADQNQTQADLFGVDPGDQLALFDEIQRYAAARGIVPDDEFKQIIQQVFEKRRASRAEDVRQLNLSFIDSLSTEVGVAGRTGTGRLDQVSGRIGVSSETGEMDRGALQLRDSLFRHELIGDGKITFVGRTFQTTDDLVRMAQVVRNPRFETFYFIPVKKSGDLGFEVMAPYAVTSRLPHAAMVLAEGDTIDSLVPYLKDADGYYLMHNHPSGITDPSQADYRVTKAIENKFPGFLGHVIINHMSYSLIGDQAGGNFVTFRSLETTEADPLRKVMPAGAIVGTNVAGPEDVAALAKRFEDNPTGLTIFFRSRKNTINAIATLDLEDVTKPDFTDRLREMALNNGSSEVSAYVRTDLAGPLPSELTALNWMSVISEIIYDDGISIRNDYYPASEGYIGIREPKGIRVMEDPIETDLVAFGPDDKPMAAGNLGMMDKVRPIEMPELVRLVRDLTGDIPFLKTMKPNRHGYMTPLGRGRITLNRRIFADPAEATKTLAHEIGHLVDYLPEETLSRGNLFGRLATLRDFLKTTFPRLGGDLDKVMTPKIRQKLRREAEKQVGPRPPKDEEADLAAWREEVSRVYKENVAVFMDENDLVGIDRVRGELLSLSADWRGDWADAPEWFQKYRESSVELYADAISVLFNAPEVLRNRAPVFWDMFWDLIGRKPEAEAQLLGIQEMLSRGQMVVLKDRQNRLREAFGKGEEIFIRKARERELQRMSWRGMLDRLMQDHYDVAWPLLRRANEVESNGKNLPWHEDPRKLFNAHPLSENRVYRFVGRVHERIITPLESSNISLDDLGEYFFNNRVLNEEFEESLGRSKLANPLGITPIQARKQLLNLRLQLGIERMTVLESTARFFQDMTFGIFSEMRKAGMIAEKVFEETIEPNRYNYATFAVLDRLEDNPHIAAGLRKQFGTFKDIANPFMAMTLKAITGLRAVEVQKAKNLTVKFLQRHFPDELEPAKEQTLANGRKKILDPIDRSKKLLVEMRNGKPKGYYVDQVIGNIFEFSDPEKAGVITRFINKSFGSVFYPLFIKYNPAFQFYLSPVRDFKRTLQNAPFKVVEAGSKQSSLKLAAEYLKNYPTAMRRMRGELDPLIREMTDLRAIGTPYDNFGGNAYRDDYFGEMMRKYNLLPDEKKVEWWQKGPGKYIQAIGDWILFQGQVLESLPRISTYRMLTRDMGWKAPQAAEFVRNHVGVPPFWIKGRKAYFDGAIFPFINVASKGYGTDLSLMSSPKTRAGWWFRYFSGDGLSTMLKWAAGAGLFGASIKEYFDAIGGYDKTNYQVIPLGWQEGGEYGKKAVYLRVPMDESSRMVSGMMYNTLEWLRANASEDPEINAQFTDVLNFAGGQIPGLNPIIEIGNAWRQYATGFNPRDNFRNTAILSNDEWLAGGFEGTQSMLGWTMDQTGATNFINFDPQAETTLEFGLSLTPVLNRIIKVSDSGFRQQQMSREEFDAKIRASVRLRLPQNVEDLRNEYYTVRQIDPENRTVWQAQRWEQLRVWFNQVYSPTFEGMVERVTWDKNATIDAEIDALGVMSETFVTEN